MPSNACIRSIDSSDATVVETRENDGRSGTESSGCLSCGGQAHSPDCHLELAGQPRNEVSTRVLKHLLNEYRERNGQQDRELASMKQQLDAAFTVQNRLAQRLAEIASFALLVYRGSPIQVFPDVHEILDTMFTRLFETTIHIRRFEKDEALSSLESLMSRMELLESFLRRSEAACRSFIGDEGGRRENERFLLTHIPPQIVIPSFGTTLDRTRLPYPDSYSCQASRTPPNSPVAPSFPTIQGRKRSRTEAFEEGELPSKRKC
ncbi:hypothetical protein K435DRAFT_877548 [Dendrothele bispora CBS 962.96]|uniref:Uncharacterized protein n=1 Tax=Dendrothele bispora (strain CBS 962.96) TaxID=1314807 RepID=A0A4S8KPX8_DENBC|nr:hypothetical protein K435DRAFT_877548 [Dendrothele bispora CBS 962.96]